MVRVGDEVGNVLELQNGELANLNRLIFRVYEFVFV